MQADITRRSKPRPPHAARHVMAEFNGLVGDKSNPEELSRIGNEEITNLGERTAIEVAHGIKQHHHEDENHRQNRFL